MNIWQIQINFDSIKIQWVIFKRLAVQLILFKFFTSVYLKKIGLGAPFAIKYFIIDGQVFNIFRWAFLEALQRAEKIQFGYTYIINDSQHMVDIFNKT